MKIRELGNQPGPSVKKLLLVFGIILLLFVIKPFLFQVFGSDIPTEPASPQPQTHGMDDVEGGLVKFWSYTGFANVLWGNLVMISVGLIFIFLAIRYEYEPLLLVPIGTGIILGNIPFLHLSLIHI